MDSFKSFWKNAFNVQGISTRKDMWIVLLFNFVITFILNLIDTRLGSLYTLIYFIPQISLSVRRLHDTGHTAKPLIVSYVIEFICLILIAINKLFNWIPIVGILTTIIFVIIPSIVLFVVGIYMFIMLYCIGSKFPQQYNNMNNQPYNNSYYNQYNNNQNNSNNGF